MERLNVNYNNFNNFANVRRPSYRYHPYNGAYQQPIPGPAIPPVPVYNPPQSYPAPSYMIPRPCAIQGSCAPPATTYYYPSWPANIMPPQPQQTFPLPLNNQLPTYAPPNYATQSYVPPPAPVNIQQYRPTSPAYSIISSSEDVNPGPRTYSGPIKPPPEEIFPLLINRQFPSTSLEVPASSEVQPQEAVSTAILEEVSTLEADELEVLFRELDEAISQQGPMSAVMPTTQSAVMPGAIPASIPTLSTEELDAILGVQPVPDSTQQHRSTRVRYTDQQIQQLEGKFRMNRYLTLQERQALAQSVGVSEFQIKIWFQNRRAKLKQQNKNNTG